MAQEFVRPLEDAWQPVIDAVLRRSRGAAVTSDVAKLAPRLVELSHAYNAGLAGGGARVPLEARVAFSFARDVPKGAAAVRELVRCGALAPTKDRALRIVDLGAGLGAMTWGIVRALSEHARPADRAALSEPAPRADLAAPSEPALRAEADLSVEALLVDEDGDALVAAESIAREAAARGVAGAHVRLTVRTRKERLAAGMSLPEADLVVLGQVLSELDVATDPAARVVKHAALVADLLERVVAPGGALVIVEPALRDRTRHLHAVRDALAPRAGVTVFAPCLHALACPMLATEGEWCHEDLPVDLPAWVVPLARAAGLRWQGLTFSYLVLRRDDRSLAAELDVSAHGPASVGDRVHLRVVSELMRTKGKAEVFGCTRQGARVRLRRLDRDATDEGPGAAASAAWASLGRGDVVTIDSGESAPVDERGRVSPTAQVDVWRIRK